ncbi:hypothetical protein [Litorilituus lipolyticus]|uniref:Uncharacterized protein n=1 Tax=Litorilituus lipolyticus TaxID=2491017 RepID=A0A502KPJ7_9GAMM|nr:hypothetical protein [Litorilituus lipolyticus]TPH13426.1 hypothetical protein EPA86_14655 [Litorilituus lipolyticus]
MEFNTPQAIRKIKLSKQDNLLINGKKQCKLQAMTFALNYHRIDVTDTPYGLKIRGTVPVGM